MKTDTKPTQDKPLVPKYFLKLCGDAIAREDGVPEGMFYFLEGKTKGKYYHQIEKTIEMWEEYKEEH